ncbi:hypothetical protein DRN93_02945, partial [archaeon]
MSKVIRPLALIKEADSYKSVSPWTTGNGAVVECHWLGVDYYYVKGRLHLSHLWLLSYLRVLQEVKEKINDFTQIENERYFFVSITELAALFGCSRQQVKHKYLKTLERYGYIKTAKYSNKTVFFVPSYLEPIRPVPGTPHRLPFFFFDSSMTVTELLILDQVYRRYCKIEAFNTKDSMIHIPYAKIAEALGCTKRTVIRGIKALWARGYLTKMTTLSEKLPKSYLKPTQFNLIKQRMETLMSPVWKPLCHPLYNNINTSYLYYHFQLNTSYLIVNLDLPISDRNRRGPVDISMSTQGSSNKSVSHFLFSTFGGIMDKYNKMQEEIRARHMKKRGDNITTLTGMLRAYFPGDVKRSVLLPMEKNIVKQLYKVCQAEGVSFDQFLDTFSKIRPSLEADQFLKRMLSSSFILALSRPEIVDRVLSEITRPKRRKPVGVIVGASILCTKNLPPMKIEYDDGSSEQVGFMEGYETILKIKKMRLSNYKLGEVYLKF